MSKFAKAGGRTKQKLGAGPLKTKAKRSRHTVTREGGKGWTRGSKTALFLASVGALFGEPNYYETGDQTAKRIVDLTHKVAKKDPAWLCGFVPWLRGTANIRTTSYVIALEAAVAAGPGTPGMRQLVASSMLRPDEPAEALAYYLTTYGRDLPMSIKKGIADAAVRMYSEKNFLKYDTARNAVRMADVIELCHPKPKAEWQSALFQFILTDRHQDREAAIKALPDRTTDVNLHTLRSHRALTTMPEAKRKKALKSPELARVMEDAAFTWEDVGGWAPGGMTKEAWEAVIPQMGYMALLRNLRNFEKAKISQKWIDYVRAKLSNPEEVARSRQFPYRFLSAYKEIGVTFQSAVGDGMRHSLANVPTFPGKTLVLVDTSGSMQNPVSNRSSVQRYEVAAVLGAALAYQGGCDLISYGTTSSRVPTAPDILTQADQIRQRIGIDGHGTNTWQALRKHYDNHDRVFIITDEQTYGSPPKMSVPVYTWNIGGYGASHADLSKPGWYTFGGFTDACFRLIPMIERGEDAPWPWEASE